MKNIEGMFIVLDGIDFCGKGTQAGLLVEYLMNHPLDQEFKLINVLHTREPSNSPFTLEIRETLQSELDPSAKKQRLTELFVKDRQFHLDNVILPALKAGVWVVCDRYMYSTLAYQSAQGVDMNELVRMHEGMRVPDAVFVIDVPGKESLARKARKRDKRPDEMFDQVDFQERLRENYLGLRTRLPDHPLRVLDGVRPIQDIAGEIREVVDSLVSAAYGRVRSA